MANDIEIQVGLKARDSLTLRLSVDGDAITRAQLAGIGCLPFLRLLAEWRPKLQGALAALPLPEGVDHGAVLLREALLKAQGRWKYPYTDEELCHCRAIATRVVDDAIVGGCHSLEGLRAATSANTSCGTCRTDIESILAYRLKAPSQSA